MSVGPPPRGPTLRPACPVPSTWSCRGAGWNLRAVRNALSKAEFAFGMDRRGSIREPVGTVLESASFRDTSVS